MTTIARAVDILFDPQKYRPESRETADHSLPYCLAVAIVDRKITTESFSDTKMKDERIWLVIDRIKGEASQEFEQMFPAKQPSRVVIRTSDGREFEQYLEYPKGDPREPMTLEDLTNKFNALASGRLDSNRMQQLQETIFACETMSVREFVQQLVI